MPSPFNNSICALVAFENSMVHIEFQGSRLHGRAARLITDKHECIHFAQFHAAWDTAMTFCNSTFCNVAVHMHGTNFLQYSRHVLL